jgi:hypothetical protein
MNKSIIICGFLLISLFAFAQVSFELVTENFNSIDIGSNSTPLITDLDGNSILDLMVGDHNGNINHYAQNMIHILNTYIATASD